uniref:DNA-directed RNA polymerase n=1 Tax=Chlorodesmis fastigiata TaxID=189431 RepID=A0A2P0QHE8_CHLFS|nr:RNA polymerase b-subunit [Chlorodesmis fastigiata]ARO74162.1 RNA polymerase b-subunit [Chlorodesmis fastigiata]
MYFIFYKFLFLIPDFLEIQRKSFYFFLNNKLSEEFSKINPLTKSEFYLFWKNLKFLKPDQTIKECIILEKTYCCHFYLPVNFKIKKKWILKWIFMGTLPLLTRRGHFLVNGTPRIVLNQIVRSAGIYFYQKNMENTRSFYAEIIADRGPWIQVELDKKKNLWVSSPQGLKIDFSAFFYDFYQKYLDHYFFHKIKEENKSFYLIKLNEIEYLEKNFRRKKKLLHHRKYFFSFIFTKLLIKFHKNPFSFRIRKKINQKIVKNIIFLNIFQNKTQSILNIRSFLASNFNFDLGENGRFRLNTKLGLSLKTRTLTPIDFLSIIEMLNELTQNRNLEVLDDIDDFKNRKFKTLGELLQNQLVRAFQRFKKIFFETNNKSELHKNSTSLRKSINSVLKEFFHSHQLSQYLDQSNPLSEITHKRRLSCLGSGGINRDTAGMNIRGIHVTHYGRICPIETPEGKNAGLVNSLTTGVKNNFQGFLETPFREVYKQHLQNQKKLTFFSVENQQFQNIFFSNKFPKLKHISVNALNLYTKKFQKHCLNSINLIISNPQHFLSIATICIPFIEHNDANRALMGSNMQRQALPLLYLEQPLVTTLNAFRVLSDLNDIPAIVKSGFILYVSQKKISFFNGEKSAPTLLSKRVFYQTRALYQKKSFGLLNFD